MCVCVQDFGFSLFFWYLQRSAYFSLFYKVCLVGERIRFGRRYNIVCGEQNLNTQYVFVVQIRTESRAKLKINRKINFCLFVVT